MDALLTSLRSYASKTGDMVVEHDMNSGCLVLRYANSSLVLKSQKVSSVPSISGSLLFSNDSKTVTLTLCVMNGKIYELCKFTVNGASTVYSDIDGICSIKLYDISFYSLKRHADKSIHFVFFRPSHKDMLEKCYKDGVCVRNKMKIKDGIEYMYKYSQYGLRRCIFPLVGDDISFPVAYFNADGSPERVAVVQRMQMLFTVKYFVHTTMIMYSMDRDIIYQGEYTFCKPFYFLPHGTGEQYYKGKKLYSGQFQYGYRSGNGSLYYSNGNVKYSGEWLCDVPHGAGTIYNWKGEPYCKIQSTYGKFFRFPWNETVFDYCPSEGLLSFFSKSNVKIYSEINQTPFSLREKDFQLTYNPKGLTLTNTQLEESAAPLISPKREVKLNRVAALKELLVASGYDKDKPGSITSLAITKLPLYLYCQVIDLSCLDRLEELLIGDGMLQQVRGVAARYLIHLKTIEIGSAACSSASLELVGLPALHSLTISSQAFQYSSSLLIENCISLELIHFDASCFGKLLTLSLSYHPTLKTVHFGSSSFGNLTSLSISCCPMLDSIQLMKDSLPSLVSLSLQKLPLFTTIVGGNGCFTNLVTLTTLEITGNHTIAPSS